MGKASMKSPSVHKRSRRKIARQAIAARWSSAKISVEVRKADNATTVHLDEVVNEISLPSTSQDAIIIDQVSTNVDEVMDSATTVHLDEVVNKTSFPSTSHDAISIEEVAVNVEDVIDDERMEQSHESIESLEDDNLTDNMTNSLQINGRRIVDIQFFMEQILNSGRHEPFDCSIIDMELLKEIRHGLVSEFVLKCKFCNKTSVIQSDTYSTNCNTNSAITLGALSVGIGYSQLEELLTAVNIPPLSSKTYQASHQYVADQIHATAWESMKAAAEEEKKLALDVGDVNAEGIPNITVICDGAWSKRSYRTNYNALSGTACIIGAKTGKLLFLGIRNKYCTVCAKKSDNSSEIPAHKCFKNWNGPSTAMEADIIVEGFKQSVPLYGIVYSRVVGDGDSSVHKRLLQEKPYGHQHVEKVECKNHLLRNMCTRLKEVGNRKKSNANGLAVPMYLRKALLNRILRIRTAVQKATLYRNNEDTPFSEKVQNLNKDILNAPSHIFGEHKDCKEIGYFCSGEPKNDEENLVGEMEKCGLFTDIKQSLHRIIQNSPSLLTNMDNNAAESYNSVLCKFVGGKRINFSLRGSYLARAEAAAISYNARGAYHQIISRTLGGTSKQIRKFVNRKIRIMSRRKKRDQTTFRKRTKVSAPADENYGGDVALALVPDNFEEKKQEFFEHLAKNKEEIVFIEKNTRGQRNSAMWHQERSSRLTASWFGEICRMRKTTDPKKKVSTILYSRFSGNVHTKYGNDHENIAIETFKKETGLNVENCGFFVDEKDPFLGASPDGIISLDEILEIKCPSTCKDLHPMDGISQKKINFAVLDENNKLQLKRNHKYYYQVQGQLHITKRQHCYFVIWTPLGMVYEKIERDDRFWKEMKSRLKIFYMDHLLPELVFPQLKE